MRRTKRRILYIEDADADVLIMQRTIATLQYPVDLSVVKDGEAALQFLLHEDTYQDSPKPHIIILDLSIPKVHGFEVLHTVKHNESLRTIPVIVLTTSHDPCDCQRSYQEHANAYIVKPIKMHVFRDIMRILIPFWVDIVSLVVD